MTPKTTRESALSQAANRTYDVIVVGGGITGACAAWDAATRGLSVLLLERGDFAAATSAHSLKILHGGIRYLQHLDIARLRQSCRERSIFLDMAPRLTEPKAFVVPTYGHGMQGKTIFRAALWLLRLLTFDRNRRIADECQRIPAGHTISRDEVRRRFPFVSAKGLTGAAVFYDGVLLNPPRLVFEIVQTAVEAGASAFNYCNVSGVGRAAAGDGDLRVSAVDAVAGASFEFRARSVINAAGPYAPWLPLKDAVSSAPPPLSRDMAFVIDRDAGDSAAIAIQTQYRDPDAIITRGNRHLFMVPWRRYTLLGVHSRVYTDHPDALDVTESEIANFIDEVNAACPPLALCRDDILAVNAGLLPFGDNEGDAEDLSFGKRSLVRDHGSEDLPGLVSAISVRWTMGRATAEQAVDRAERHLRGRNTPCRTSRLRIRGSADSDHRAVISAIKDDPLLGGLTDDATRSVASHYGSHWTKLRIIAGRDPSMLATIGDTPVLRGQVHLSASEEMVCSLADIVLRRTDIGSGEMPSDAVLRECADIAAPVLGWTEERIHREVADTKRLYPFYQSSPMEMVEAEALGAA